MSLTEGSKSLFSGVKYHKNELRICRGLMAENVLELPGSLKPSVIESVFEKAQVIYHNKVF